MTAIVSSSIAAAATIEALGGISSTPLSTISPLLRRRSLHPSCDQGAFQHGHAGCQVVALHLQL